MSYLGRYWHLVFLGMFAVLVATGLNLVSPLIVRDVVDKVLIEKQYSTLPLYTLGIVGISVLRGIFRFIQRYVQSYVGQRVVFDIRTDLFQALQEKSFSFYDKRRTGQLMSRATNDVERVRVLQSWWIAAITTSTLTTISITAILISLNLKLTLLSTIIFPPIFICAYILSKTIRPKYQEMRQLMGTMTSIVQENIVGTRVVRAFAREDFEIGKFGEKNTKYLDTRLETVKLRATYGPLMNLILSFGIIIVYWFGGGEAIRGELSIGTLVAFASYLSMLANPVRFLGFLITFYSSAITAAERIFEIMDFQTEVKESPTAIELPLLKG
ncbi:MAG: ABC transporter ATP-binding protein, partial [Candidatus Bathyarchaeota archaeon]